MADKLTPAMGGHLERGNMKRKKISMGNCCQYGSFRYPHHCAKSNPELEAERLLKPIRKLKRCTCEYCNSRAVQV